MLNFVRWLGIGFIAFGVGILGGMAYSWWFQPNVAAELQVQSMKVAELPVLDESFDSGFVPEGEVFARLFVPSWGDTWVRPIVEGTDAKSLDLGVGHYAGAELPGVDGNFALASHRTVSGANFRDINNLEEGDKLFVETSGGFYEYMVTNHVVVKPNAVGVLDDVPEGVKVVDGASRYITLTTCDPVYGDWDRYVVFGVYVGFYSKDSPPDTVKRIISAVGL